MSYAMYKITAFQFHNVETYAWEAVVRLCGCATFFFVRNNQAPKPSSKWNYCTLLHTHVTLSRAPPQSPMEKAFKQAKKVAGGRASSEDS